VAGPLAGVRVLELGGIGPGPFACMLLADMGADVVRIDRPGGSGLTGNPILRGRRSICVDMKRPDGVEVVLRLAASSDVVVEGWRPGVAERLGVGPEQCSARNERIVYGRMTGWGQDGPYAQVAGHDINYIALAGALHHIGRADQAPTPPLNLVGDFGGGGLLLAYGIVCALCERSSSGIGQVVDAAMVDGAALLMTVFANRGLGGPRGTNRLDSGAPYYDAYECADGMYISIGALEPQFYAEFRKRLGLDRPEWDDQNDTANWPARKADLGAIFRTKTRDEWCSVFDGADACFAPVLSLEEAMQHPHNQHRGTFVRSGGINQPAPAPRLSRTPGALTVPPPLLDAHTDEVLAELGFSAREIGDLREAGAIGMRAPSVERGARFARGT
jgi:alpha-methylacyl-CoA racemase